MSLTMYDYNFLNPNLAVLSFSWMICFLSNKKIKVACWMESFALYLYHSIFCQNNGSTWCVTSRYRIFTYWRLTTLESWIHYVIKFLTGSEILVFGFTFRGIDHTNFSLWTFYGLVKGSVVYRKIGSQRYYFSATTNKFEVVKSKTDCKKHEFSMNLQ